MSHNAKFWNSVLVVCSMSAVASVDAYAQTLTKSDRYQSKTFGIGPVISSEPGIGVHAQLDRSEFVKADLAYARDRYFDLSADYAVGYPDAFGAGSAVIPYWGVGATFIGEDTSEERESGAIGMRIPVGLNIHIGSTPLMASVEAAPTVLVVPSTDSYLRASASLKVMF